jgi:hypothetical protein
MRLTAWLIGIGVVAFLGGAIGVLWGLYEGNSGVVSRGLYPILGSGACFAIAAWRSHRRVDWRRVELEQRLWQSGPLGRAWLRIRQRLPY